MQHAPNSLDVREWREFPPIDRGDHTIEIALLCRTIDKGEAKRKGGKAPSLPIGSDELLGHPF
jgi:hypothetical protein